MSCACYRLWQKLATNQIKVLCSNIWMQRAYSGGVQPSLGVRGATRLHRRRSPEVSSASRGPHAKVQPINDIPYQIGRLWRPHVWALPATFATRKKGQE